MTPDTLADAHEDWADMQAPVVSDLDRALSQHRLEGCRDCARVAKDSGVPSATSQWCRDRVSSRLLFEARCAETRAGVEAALAVLGYTAVWEDRMDIVLNGAQRVRARLILHERSARVESFTPDTKLRIELGDYGDTVRLQQPKGKPFDYALVAQKVLGKLWSDAARRAHWADQEQLRRARAALLEAATGVVRGALPVAFSVEDPSYDGKLQLRVDGLSLRGVRWLTDVLAQALASQGLTAVPHGGPDDE